MLWVLSTCAVIRVCLLGSPHRVRRKEKKEEEGCQIAGSTRTAISLLTAVAGLTTFSPLWTATNVAMAEVERPLRSAMAFCPRGLCPKGQGECILFRDGRWNCAQGAHHTGHCATGKAVVGKAQES